MIGRYEWDYDSVGNRTRQVRSGSVTYYEYDSANQLTRSNALGEGWTYYQYDPQEGAPASLRSACLTSRVIWR